MTTTQQPEAHAIYLARELKDGLFSPNILQNEQGLRRNSSAELLRLHARVVELECRLEIDPSHSIDGISTRDSTIKLQDDRIAQLESQLEAIGAGGVETLRKSGKPA